MVIKSSLPSTFTDGAYTVTIASIGSDATLDNPDTMMEYYRKMKDVYAKEYVIEAIQNADKEMDEPTGCMQVLVKLTLGMLEESLNAEKKQELYVLLQTLNGLNQEVML